MSYPITHPDRGVARQVLAEAPELMLVSVRFEAGAKGALHSHPHVQSSYCVSGRFRFLLNGEEHDLRAGDSLLIPGGAEHGCHCLETGELIDSFTPRRDDFL
ncbi:cupin domain-containing protein [uncultured Thioclava sp.]|uniref:cupin domain-containing protein n=1 Tax=uncultured Thioclava sp. TaxID=473858 RepID=UPI0025E32928|nr:cupin domain-containing protein [uncultured Thioclava sp.]